MVNGKITNSGLSQEIIKYYYSSELMLSNGTEEFQNMYCFLSQIEPWDNENLPPEPDLSDKGIKSIFKSMFALKKINIHDMSPVIERIDWKENTTYEQYSSENKNLFDVDSEGKLVNKFYIKNSHDQVFKCLSNGKTINSSNGSVSIQQPIIDFSYDSTDGYIESNDGYKWKYLYTVDVGSKLKFLDDNWMPLPPPLAKNNISTSTIGAGEITTINIYNTGNNYVDDTGLGISTTIGITGDGTGATAVAVIAANTLSRILVTNKGSNYTYATATISPNLNFTGSGAEIIPEISPIGGHGYNLVSELCCKRIMVTFEFNLTENNTIPTSIDFRQIGLVINPIYISSYASDFNYNMTSSIFVSPGGGSFTQDEIVFQGTDVENSTFSGRVLNFKDNIIYVINTIGTLSSNELIKGQSSTTIRVANSLQEQFISPFSGEITYVENRTKVQRSDSGLEQFRLTINY